MKQLDPPRRYTQPMGAQEGVLNSEEAVPPRHRHSTPSDGEEVAAAVDQQSDDSDCTEDPEVFFQRGSRWQSRPTEPQQSGRPSVEATAVSPPPPPPPPPPRAVHHPITTVDVTQLHAFRSDHLSPAVQDGKCAH